MRTLAIAYLLLTSSLQAGVIHTGSFRADDQTQLFLATLNDTSLFTARSLGYGGDAATSTPSGGFDTVLSLFDANTGLLLALNNDGICPPSTLDLGNCWDAEISLSLGPGSYLIALTQYDNLPNGPLLADGFARTGQGNFTPTLSGYPGTSFVDSAGNQRSNRWAVFFDGATSVSEVPEPGTFLLSGLTLAALSLTARSRS